MPALKIPRSLVVCLGLAVLNVAGWSQTPDVATPSAPTSASPTPDEFMRTAADAMSLTAPDMKPWHMRAHFNRFNQDGSVKQEGVFEEWWAAPDRYKVAYTGADQRYIGYGLQNGVVYTGDYVGTASTEARVSQILLHPLPDPVRLGAVTFTYKDASAGTSKLRCYTEATKGTGARLGGATSFCFDYDLPTFRASQNHFGIRTWNGIVKVQGHYVAKQFREATNRQDPLITVDVEQIEPGLGLDESALTPPADEAFLHDRKVAVSADFMQSSKISGDPPRYPSDAKAANVQGTVVIEGTVDKEGAVNAMHVISGPPMLQQAALDAVKTWRYHPYLIAGEPVEVQTTINVVFDLTR